MLSTDPFVLIGNFLVIWAAFVATCSVVVHSRVHWWRSEMGRHLFYYMLIMAAVLDLSIVRMFLGDQWWFSLFRLVIFTGVPIVMTQRLVLQLRAQRAAVPDTSPERTDH